MVDTPQPKASLINAQLGPYAIDALVGRGAMGAVYLARDRHLRRNVALKVMLGSLARNPEAIRQFRLEAQAAAPLRHPNIVRIYEAGIREGTPFIAMEYIEGESLEQFLQRTPRLDWEQALHIVRQVAEALACAHEAGIIHRDVKPANMLIDRRGRIRLTDFGIANRDAIEQGSGRPPMGTLEYMAPELLSGNRASMQTDLYALGVVAYRMLSGAMPVHGGSPEALAHRIQEGKVAPLRSLAPDLPDDVARFAMRLLALKPEDRPTTCRDVVSTIDRLHREKGGGSAVPEALDRYIREQSQARSIRLDGRHGGDTSKTRPRKTLRPTAPQGWRQTALYVGGLMLLFAVAVLAGLRPWAEGHRAFAVSATMHLESLSATSQGLPLMAHTWAPAAVAEDGRTGALYCLLQGQLETQKSEGAMIVAIGPENTASAQVLAQASSPWKEGATQPPSLHLLQNGSGGGLPYALHREGSADGGSWRLTPLGTSGPYIALPQDVMPTGFGAPWSDTPIALHTASHQVAVIQRAQLDQGYEVRLLTSSHGIYGAPGRALTAPDESIVPGVLRFNRDGQHLYFFRHNGADELALWRVALTSGAETPLAVGRFQPQTLALDPQDRWVALTETYQDGPETKLYATTGDQIRSLGPGRTNPGAWLPDGSGLILAEGTGESVGLNLVVVDSGTRRHLATIPAESYWSASLSEASVVSLEGAEEVRLARHALVPARAEDALNKGATLHAARP